VACFSARRFVQPASTVQAFWRVASVPALSGSGVSWPETFPQTIRYDEGPSVV